MEGLKAVADAAYIRRLSHNVGRGSEPALAAHPSFVREIPYGAETEFRFVQRAPDPEIGPRGVARCRSPTGPKHRAVLSF